MSYMNLMPGIHNVKIYSNKEAKESPIVKLNSEIDNEINIEFTLTGLQRLINPVNSELHSFYLYVLLSYQNGGKDINFISSADIYCDTNNIQEDNLRYETSLEIPKDLIYLDEDFVFNYYLVDIVISDKIAEDGSDLYKLLQSDKLFTSKLSITYEDEHYGER